ncbi:hypothetical protein IV203_034705 [Nitzschia inconspicua]|uniref:Uncharacterized protein n=1 Tax=Nitzschia inconspicua TaxID=303405 RepID=A0A9K3PTX5_9STRA|nr:hypothetical protein IV203_034705 [Nitzschia inconspicua]
MIPKISSGNGGGSGKVHPLFLMVTALAALMASAVFFQCQSLSIRQATKSNSKLQVKPKRSINSNKYKPMTTEELVDATLTIRKQLSKLGEAMEKNETWLEPPASLEGDDIYSSMTLDISPVYDIVDAALDTVGVKGLYFWVFTDGELEWWFEDRPEEDEHWDCWETHGTNLCNAYEPWWFYHYIGAITAEKLLQEGSVLWDPVTRERVDTMSELLHLIHDRMADKKQVMGDMPFHAQHALLWHYGEVMYPNIDRFPEQMARDLCGDEYAYRKVSKSGKAVGHECFHGMGHAVFYIIARQQMREEQRKRQKGGLSPWKPKEQPWSARTQFRPSAGLELTQESWCKIYKYCQTDLGIAEGYTLDVADRCIGGARHSVRIFSRDDDMRWHYTTDASVRNRHFDLEMEKCRKLEAAKTR